MVKAHRHAWQLVQGTPPPVRSLRHRCPNLNCVNPDHLVVMDHEGSPNALAKPAASRFSEK